MVIQNITLVNNKLGSWLSRIAIASIIILSALITSFISLQFFYQQQVDSYFANLSQSNLPSDEAALIIRTKENWITASGRHKETYKPLLAQELGAYQSHEYLGWFFSYDDWLNSNDGLPFTLLYEVQYEQGISQETFFFNGILPAKLKAREVRIN